MISKSDLEKIIKSIEDDSCGVVLDLSNAKIDAEQTESLCNALSKNRTLQSLNLSNNRIGKLGAYYLADALSENTTLVSLDLGSNQLGYEEVEQLANGLSKNKTLQNLDLSNNKIEKLGAYYLTEALSQNKTLLRVILIGNKIDADLEKSISDIMKTRQKVKEEDQKGCDEYRQITAFYNLKVGVSLTFSKNSKGKSSNDKKNSNSI